MSKKIILNYIIISLFFFFLGVIFGSIERYFYHYLDSNNILHESIFFPLSLFSIYLGIFILLILVIRIFFYFIKSMKFFQKKDQSPLK